jgi:hypothetical protein
MFPLPVAVLEVFMRLCPQLVCHDLSDVVHSSKITTFEVEFVFWEKKEVTRTQIRRVWSKSRSRRWQCERARSRDTESKCTHDQFLGHNVVDGLAIQIQLTADHCDRQMSIRPAESPHFGRIFFRFWCASSSRTRFVFHNLTAIQNALCNLKTCALDTACSP